MFYRYEIKNNGVENILYLYILHNYLAGDEPISPSHPTGKQQFMNGGNKDADIGNRRQRAAGQRSDP